MNFSQAIETVHKKVEELKIRDKYGERVQPILALTPVAMFCGERYTRTIDNLQKGVTTPQVYCDEMLGMIADYKRHKFMLDVEKKLSQIPG